MACVLPAAAGASHSQVERLSLGPVGGNGPDNASAAAPAPHTAISADASRVYFTTQEQLVPQDTDGRGTDVYERANGVTRLVSTGPAGGNESGFVFLVTVTEDGSRAFFTTEEHLLAEDTDDQSDIYAATPGGLELVTTGPTGGARDFFFHNFRISRDGTVAFFTTDQRMTAADTDDASDVYRRYNGVTTLVTPGTATSVPRLGSTEELFVSDDGERVFFQTVDGLVPEDADGAVDVYEWHAGDVHLASTGPGAPASWPYVLTRDARLGGISRDGERVFFQTAEPLTTDEADTCRSGSQEFPCVDVFERSGGVTRRVSVSEVASTDQHATYAGNSRDGARVLFHSLARFTEEDQETSAGCTPAVAGPEACADLYERVGGDTRLVSTGPADPHSPGVVTTAPNARLTGLSADGTHAYFTTFVPLVAEDTDTCTDIYARAGGTTELISRGPTHPNCEDGFFFRRSSANGDRAFFSAHTHLTADDTDFGCHEFDFEEEVSFEVPCSDVYEWHDGRVSLVSGGPNPAHNGPFQSRFSGSSADGRIVILTTEAPLLADDTDNGCFTSDPFVPPVPCFDVYSVSVAPSPPDCSSVSAAPSSLWPANKHFRAVTLSDAAGADGDAVPVEITGVTQDERVGATPDARRVRGNAVDLRSDRDPRGDGRVYRVSFRATDADGETCLGEAAVEVRRHQHREAVESAPPAFDSLGP